MTMPVVTAGRGLPSLTNFERRASDVELRVDMGVGPGRWSWRCPSFTLPPPLASPSSVDRGFLMVGGVWSSRSSVGSRGQNDHISKTTPRQGRSFRRTSMRPPQAAPGKPRQHLVAEIRQLIEIIDEGQRNGAHAGLADAVELVGHAVGRPHEWVAADGVGCEILALLDVLLGWNGLRRDALVGEHAVDRAPVRVLDDGVAVILLRLLLARTADHLPDGVDLDLAPERLRRALDLRDLLDIALERRARARRRHEERVAIAQREGLPDLRRAGIHQDRPGAAERLGIRAHALEPQELSVEIERVRVRPRLLDGVEPFLREVVARVVLALGDAEHLELALVPADHEIDAEATFADMVGGDEFLGGDQRMEQRRVHGAEHGHALRHGEEAHRPGDGLERAAVKIGLAAIALPAADRQHEVDAGLVGHAGEAGAVRPARGPALRHLGGGAAGRAVGAEHADLQRIGVVHGDALMHRCGAGQQDLSPSQAKTRMADERSVIRRSVHWRVTPSANTPYGRYGPSSFSAASTNDPSIASSRLTAPLTRPCSV